MRIRLGNRAKVEHNDITKTRDIKKKGTKRKGKTAWEEMTQRKVGKDINVGENGNDTKGFAVLPR